MSPAKIKTLIIARESKKAPKGAQVRQQSVNVADRTLPQEENVENTSMEEHLLRKMKEQAYLQEIQGRTAHMQHVPSWLLLTHKGLSCTGSSWIFITEIQMLLNLVLMISYYY